MKLRLATPTVLVDVGRVRDLSYVRDDGDHIAIGALTRHRDLETTRPARAASAACSRAVAAQVGDNQVRHRGTIGGSVAHGDPASDLPAALLALDADVRRRRARRRARRSRRPTSSTGFLETALAPDELLTEIRVPQDAARTGSRSRSSTAGPRTGRSSARSRRASNGAHARRRSSTWARRRCAATRGRDGARAGRVARPTRPQHAAEGTEPPADLNASLEYREHLARVLVRRALEEAGA